MSISRNELRLSLEGLNCAQCSARIEESVQRLPGVSFAALDLVAGRLRVVLTGEGNGDETLSRIRGIVDSIEPGVSVSEERAASQETAFPKKAVLRLGAGCLLWIAAMFAQVPEGVRTVLYVAAYLAAGINVLRTVFGNLRQGRIFDEFFLMTIATGGAFAIGEFSEAVAVMLFYESGEMVQDLAVAKSRRSILSLMDIRPDSAVLLEDGPSAGCARRTFGSGKPCL